MSYLLHTTGAWIFLMQSLCFFIVFLVTKSSFLNSLDLYFYPYSGLCRGVYILVYWVWAPKLRAQIETKLILEDVRHLPRYSMQLLLYSYTINLSKTCKQCWIKDFIYECIHWSSLFIFLCVSYCIIYVKMLVKQHTQTNPLIQYCLDYWILLISLALFQNWYTLYSCWCFYEGCCSALEANVLPGGVGGDRKKLSDSTSKINSIYWYKSEVQYRVALSAQIEVLQIALGRSLMYT